MEQQTILEIKGMSCASCVNRIEKAIRKDPGVTSASVNLATEKASIRYEPSKTNVASLISLISAAGYEASAPTKKREAEKKVSLQKEKRLLFLSVLLTLPLVLPMLLELFGLHLMPSPLMQLLLATPVQFIIGARF